MVFVAAQGEGSDENALRSVPMWISDPKKRPIGPEPWSTLDVVPTILSTLNATIPSDAAGRDLFAATAPQPVVTLGEAGAWVVNGDYTLTIADINQPEAVILQDETRTTVYDKDAQEAMIRFAQVVWSQAHGGRTGEEKLKDVLQSRGYWP